MRAYVCVCVCYSYKVMFFLFKFLQDITVSPIHQSDSGQRHCVGRLCYSQGGKWLSSLEHAANMHEQITFSMAERATVKVNTCNSARIKSCTAAVFPTATHPGDLKVTLLVDGADDKQPRSGLQRRLFRWRQEVQAGALAAGALHHQPVCPRALRHREEDVHRAAAGRAAAATRHVLGKFVRSDNFAFSNVCWSWPIMLVSCSWSEISRSSRQITSRWMWSIRDSWFPTENFLLPFLRDEVGRRFSSSFQLPASSLL